jgi:hypothetical protein
MKQLCSLSYLLVAALTGCGTGDGSHTSEIVDEEASFQFEIDLPNAGDEGFFCFGFDGEELAGRSVRGFRWEPPEAAAIQLHHAILFAIRGPHPDGPTVCKENPPNALGLHVWAPGGDQFELPPDVGLHLPRDTQRFAVQAHMLRVAAGPPATGRVTMLLHDREPEHTAFQFQIGPFVPTIPPFETKSSTSLCRVEKPMRAVGAWPHMHLIGKEFRGEVIRPSGERSIVVLQKPWNFEDQRIVPLDLQLSPGDDLETTCVWENPTPEPVISGHLTTNEMCVLTYFAWPPEAAYCTPH